MNLTPPIPSSNVLYVGMSEHQPPINIEPIAAVSIAALCPVSYGFRHLQSSSTHEEYLAEQERIQRMAEKVAEAEQKKKRAAPGTKGTKSKAIERDGVRGSWFPCKPDDAPMKLLVDEGFLKRDLFHYTPDEATPVPPSGFAVMCRAWMDRGMSLPPSKFFLDVLKLFKLQPHNICPNSYTIMANFQYLMEGYLGVEADVRLFQWYFSCCPEYEEGKKFCNCGSATS